MLSKPTKRRSAQLEALEPLAPLARFGVTISGNLAFNSRPSAFICG
jgi:hypothetical protein